MERAGPLPSTINAQIPSPAFDMVKTAQTEVLGSTDSMFRAFSDRTRLRILHVLLGGELCVGDIVEILQAPQPRISRHLAYLRKAKLVMVRKSGLWSHYSLAPAKTPFHREAAGMSRQVLWRSARNPGRQRPGRQDQEIRRLLPEGVTVSIDEDRGETSPVATATAASAG